MSTIHVHATDLERNVGELVVERPERAAIFERFGIDYCCGGAKSLAEACREAHIDADSVLEAFDSTTDSATADEPAAATLPTDALIAHILEVHHAFLRRELGRIRALTQRCAIAHGRNHEDLVRLDEEFSMFADDLELHMLKEERVLFPAILELAGGDRGAAAHCGGIEFPLGVMEAEHEDAGVALARFRELTGGYVAPADACASWRELCSSLSRLEIDLHHHIHEENNILHGRARAFARGV